VTLKTIGGNSKLYWCAMVPSSEDDTDWGEGVVRFWWNFRDTLFQHHYEHQMRQAHLLQSHWFNYIFY